MKLYYSPGAGAMASHITLRELDLDVELVRVDVQTHQTETGDDYFAINPKGYVPYLHIDPDTALSEGAAILQYLADQKPEANMTPREGTHERYQMQEWLTFVGTELQRILGLFFIAGHFTEDGLAFLHARLHHRLAILDAHLADHEYLMGKAYTIADAYAFTILNWNPAFGLDIDISEHKNLGVYLDKIRGRAAVQTAMKEEGLSV